MKGVFAFGQDPAELAGGDVDAQLVQLFPEQRLCDVLVVILMDDERDQRRSKVAVGSDVGWQSGHQVLAVGGLPAFAAITDDPGTDDEILNHEVFVTFEDRSGWRVGQRDDDLVGDGQLGGLEPLGGTGPLLTGVARRPGRSLERTGRDDRPGLEALEAEDFVFEFLDAVLQLANEIEQLPHQRGGFGFWDVGQRRGMAKFYQLPAMVPGIIEKLQLIQRSGKGLKTSRKPMCLQRLVLKPFSRGAGPKCLHASLGRNLRTSSAF